MFTGSHLATLYFRSVLIAWFYCLQVMNRELGEYVDAGFIEGGIYVNIGDMLQMWSGDVLIANVSFTDQFILALADVSV